MCCSAKTRLSFSKGYGGSNPPFSAKLKIKKKSKGTQSAREVSAKHFLNEGFDSPPLVQFIIYGR